MLIFTPIIISKDAIACGKKYLMAASVELIFNLMSIGGLYSLN